METVMSVTSDYYHARAEENAAEAARAPLTMVRERLLRSEAAWRIMADQASRAEKKRIELAEEKARQLAPAT